MEGSLEYNLKLESNIQNIIERNPDLAGFYAFMSELSRTTIYNYLCKINDFLCFVKKNPKELDIDDFSGFLLNKRKTSTGSIASSSYRVQMYHALKKYGEYLVAKKYLTQNPMKSIDRPVNKDSKTTIEKRKKGYLNESEIKSYIKTVKSGTENRRSAARQKNWKERDLAIIYIFLSTGIRCSALYQLDVSSIDFNKKMLTVTDKEEKVNEHYLSDEVLEIIDNWLIKREKILNGKNIDALFISNQLKRMCNKSIVNVVQKYAEEINGKNITPHKLRATYGTQLYEKTKDVYFVQKCMTHSDARTTELYIRGEETHTMEASSIMNKLII